MTGGAGSPAGAGPAGGRRARAADVVVVGSGAAGIAAALTAAAHGLSVVVVTKDLVGGATPLAQGGLAAAVGPGDSAAAHVSDTLAAGAGLCEPGAVAALAAGAPGAIDWLAGLGARLRTRELRLEGGHSRHRIVHSGDDATGAEVHRALLSALRASRVEVLDRTVALDLVLREGGAADRARPRRAGHGAGAVAGLRAAVIGADGRLRPEVIGARAVVLAAGGLGQAFATTSNPAGATGDAIAIAARAGAVLRDLEFVQFHPTVLWLPGASGQCPLITEALRGAGAVLRDHGGTPLMAGRHPRGDLAPRDVVAARMGEVIAAGGPGHVWLDATGLGRGVLEDGFPTVTAACRKHGVDPVSGYIPVAPGAHYSCGGILADLDGRTTIGGLYAVGEAASTGAQGANRLASNSVTEAIIAGRRAGDALAAQSAAAGHAAAGPAAAGLAAAGPAAARTPAAGRRRELALAMSRWAGVSRDEAGLGELLRVLSQAGERGQPAGTVRDDPYLDLETAEAASLLAVSSLIAAGALRRAESRGCHRRRDAAGAAERPWHTLARWDGRELMLAEEEM